MTENKRFGVINISKNGMKGLFQLGNDNLSVYDVARLLNELLEENEQLKASLYAEKTNTAEVINEYAKQFKRHSSQFSFMIDLAEDLGIDVSKLEALDD